MVVCAVAAITLVTAGAGTPVAVALGVEATNMITSAAIGAAASATISLGTGLAKGKASASDVLTSAIVGSFGGAESSIASTSIAPLTSGAAGVAKFAAAQLGMGAATGVLAETLNTMSTGQAPSLQTAAEGVAFDAGFGLGGGSFSEITDNAWGQGSLSISVHKHIYEFLDAGTREASDERSPNNRQRRKQISND